MADKVFPGVTPAVWACVQSTSSKEHGTVYVPPAPSNSGKATTQYKIFFLKYDIVLTYEFDGSNNLSYTVVEIQGPATETEVWGGIGQTISGCGGPG